MGLTPKAHLFPLNHLLLQILRTLEAKYHVIDLKVMELVMHDGFHHHSIPSSGSSPIPGLHLFPTPHSLFQGPRTSNCSDPAGGSGTIPDFILALAALTTRRKYLSTLRNASLETLLSVSEGE